MKMTSSQVPGHMIKQPEQIFHSHKEHKIKSSYEHNGSADCNCTLCSSQCSTLGGNISIEIPGYRSDTSYLTNDSSNESDEGLSGSQGTLDNFDPLKYEQKLYKISFRKGCPNSFETISSFYANEKDAPIQKGKSILQGTKSKKEEDKIYHNPQSVNLKKMPMEYLQSVRMVNDPDCCKSSLLQTSRSDHASILQNKNKVNFSYPNANSNRLFKGITLESILPETKKERNIAMKKTTSERLIASVKPLKPLVTKVPGLGELKGNPMKITPMKYVLKKTGNIQDHLQIKADTTTKIDGNSNDQTPEKTTQKDCVSNIDDATVAHSESYTEDVDSIVENVLKANLPVLLLAGVSQSSCDNSICEQLRTIELIEEAKEDRDIQGYRNKQKTVKNSESFIESEHIMTVPAEGIKEGVPKESNELGTEEHSKNENGQLQVDVSDKSEVMAGCCPEPNNLNDNTEISGFMSLVKCMIGRIPSHEVLCTSGASKDKYIRYVLSSDVKEVLFPKCNLLPSLMTVKSLPSSSVVLCSPLGKRKFGEMFLRVNTGQYMVAVDAFSNKEWCKKLNRLTKESLERKDEEEIPKDFPLIGEVHHGSRSLPMVYRFSKHSRKALIYVPASDLAKAFPESEHVLKNLDVMIANNELKFSLRNRTASQEEAKSLMRYKAATGCLNLEDDTWYYLTSRSILISWEDFKRAFFVKSSLPGLSIGRFKSEGRGGNPSRHDTPMKKTSSKYLPNGETLLSSAVRSVNRFSAKTKRSPVYQKKVKKRKRSSGKVEPMKKRYRSPKMRPLKTPSPKLQRTSTPVTEISKGDNLDTKILTKSSDSESIKKDSNNKVKGRSQDLQNEENHSQFSVKENEGLKGLWKMQQDILTEENGVRSTEGHEDNRPIKLKPIGRTKVKGQAGNIIPGPKSEIDIVQKKAASCLKYPNQKQHLEKVLSDAVNVNPFNQSLESLKMVKKLNEELTDVQGDDLNSRERLQGQRDCKKQQKGNLHDQKSTNKGEQAALYSKGSPIQRSFVQSDDRKKTVPSLPRKVVENPGFSDSSMQGSEDTNANTLSIVSDDSLMKVLNEDSRPRPCKGGIKDLVKLQPVISECSPLKVKMKRRTKTKGLKTREPINTPTKFKLKEEATESLEGLDKGGKASRKKLIPLNENVSETKHHVRDSNKNYKHTKKSKNRTNKSPKQNEESATDISDKWMSVSPQVMMENQRIIMRIIKSKKSNSSSHEGQMKDIPTHDETRGSKEDAKTQMNLESKKEALRLFPRLSHKDEPAKSGLAVIENGGPHSLPYVLNNGYPYIVLRTASAIFPECQCKLACKILKNSVHLSRHKLMCSYDEAKLLNEEGRQFAMKPIASCTWMVRIDRVAHHLSELNQELKNSHRGREDNKCFSLSHQEGRYE